jgi:hypothetical protein
MFPYRLFGATLAAAVIVVSASYAYAEEFSARLTGFQELGSLPNVTVNPTTGVVTAANPTGAILSDATGTLKLDLDEKAGTATWTLIYSNVGTTPPLTGTVTQAHIHFGKSRDSGGVMVFFCTNLGNGPAGTQACPANSTSPTGLTGTFTTASVVAIAGQNVAVGNFNALVDALESNTAYANIHTTALGAGEIRGQIHAADEEHEHDHDHRK